MVVGLVVELIAVIVGGLEAVAQVYRGDIRVVEDGVYVVKILVVVVAVVD